MNTAILYFSATGNGFDIATRISALIPSSKLFFIPNYNEINLESFEKVILISPIYLFGLPNNVKAFLQEIKPQPQQLFSFILHYGGFSGNAANLAYNYCKKNQINLLNVYKMKMPENFTFFASPPKWYILRCLKKSQKKILKISKNINQDKTSKIHANVFAFCDKMHEKGALAWKDLAATSFNVSEKCVHCGYCVEICSQKNISLKGEKPEFGDNCISCLACYHRCPEQAINYLDKTLGKPRYINPNVSFNNMK